MSRIIFVPQYPTPMRYQQWWFTEFPKEFEKAGFEVLVLGRSYYEMICKIVENMDKDEPNVVKGNFAPIETAISFECQQINQYMNIKLRDDDILFLADLSFPGIFTNALYHKKPKRCFAYCHATSLNHKDYFESVRYSKYPVESGHAKLFDAVFVGSNYHDNKLNWRNTLVTRLPYPPLKPFRKKKELLLVSASRPTPQKVDLDLECSIEERLNFPIIRQEHRSWEDYYKFLSKSRVLIITSSEDTFGYQIVDAVMNNCIPLAPTRCAYPEILPRRYLYEDEDELIGRLDYIFNSDDNVNVPELLCHKEMENFYSNIIQVMKGEVEPDYPF